MEMSPLPLILNLYENTHLVSPSIGFDEVCFNAQCLNISIPFMAIARDNIIVSIQVLLSGTADMHMAK